MGKDEKRAPLKTPAWETSGKWTTCVSDGFDSDDSVQLGSEKTTKNPRHLFEKVSYFQERGNVVSCSVRLPFDKILGVVECQTVVVLLARQ